MHLDDRDVFYAHSKVLHSFIDVVNRLVSAEPNRERTVTLLREPFAAILADHSWLPAEFCVPDSSGGMGGGIGNYLLYRSAARDLTLMSLVVPVGAGTPIHDHLAWGLVGLYAGEQEEWVYRRADAGDDPGRADLVETQHRRLPVGDFYELLPPTDDIHRVETVGDAPSVSLHLLGNDIGCVWRHRYEPQVHAVHPFRSSYSNEPCAETVEVGAASR